MIALRTQCILYNISSPNTATVCDFTLSSGRRRQTLCSRYTWKAIEGQDKRKSRGVVGGGSGGGWAAGGPSADCGDERAAAITIIKLRSGRELLPFRSTMHVYPPPMWSSTASGEYYIVVGGIYCSYTNAQAPIMLKKSFVTFTPKRRLLKYLCNLSGLPIILSTNICSNA